MKLKVGSLNTSTGKNAIGPIIVSPWVLKKSPVPPCPDAAEFVAPAIGVPPKSPDC